MDDAMLFCVGLLTATVLPFALLGVPAPVSLFSALAALGGTHVLATAYLFTDPDVRRFAADNPAKLIALPLALMLGVAVLFLAIPGKPFFVAAMLAYLLWNNWHFGAQNVGVASFISLYERGRPLDRTEKNAIKAGVVVGLLGVLKAMSPGYLIGAEWMPVDSRLAPAIQSAYTIGQIWAMALTAVAALLLVRAFSRKHYLTGVALFLSVTFMFAMYLTDDYTLGFVAFTVAHGLQYLIFLGAHGAKRKMAIPALLGVMLAAYLIWSNASAIRTDALPAAGLAIIYAVGIAHIWLDQCLWKMREPTRARWMRDRFAFVLYPKHVAAIVKRPVGLAPVPPLAKAIENPASVGVTVPST
jgi:hypothetical protein